MTERDEAEAGTQDNKRQIARAAVLQKVKVIFADSTYADSVIDCLVVDRSQDGVRVRTAVAVTVPEWVTLKFSDGATFRARRRWVRGVEIGFELAATDGTGLLDAMIAGLTHDQRRALIARIEASLPPE